MKQYIDREQAIHAAKEAWAQGENPEKWVSDIDIEEVCEVKRGCWIPVELDITFKCSLCDCLVSTSWDYDQDGMFDYCPCCGAKMN